jgi:coenzyme F420-dependent glucose-6-phosphate dehydrogenase
MALVGYHASHEQFLPSDLLQWAIMAEQAGFGAIHSSDHFHPWSERQGQSGFSFAWLGAAMHATRLPYGVVCSPGQRYHPAIVAQAAATLAEMFPTRFSICLGSGEALNENITGDKWITKSERNERLFECVSIIRKLFSGETVTQYGLVTIQEAKLYTLPKHLPLLIGAAVTKQTAEWMGAWVDGLITVHRPIKELQEVIDGFHRGGGREKPMYLKVQLSYAHTEEEALQGAYDQWRTNVLPSEILDDLWQVKQFDSAAQFIRPDDLKSMIHISCSPDFYIDLIHTYIDMGFQKVILHNVNRNQKNFIKDFGEKVLPFIKSKQLESIPTIGVL